MHRTTRVIGATLGLLLGMAACNNESLLAPGNLKVVNPLFERYVSMGNSLTAGFQSGGINDSTQSQSYPVLLSRQMGTLFFVPYMSRPGCPAPFTNVFTQTRLPGPPCALRKPQPVPPPYINNVAVPGAEVMDAISNLDTASNANALTTFFLGGLTQTQMMQRVNPTFVTVWLGNNDVLGAATNGANAGDTTKITDPALFQARYTAAVGAIKQTDVRGGVLIGVANVTLVPYFTQGQVYLALKLANALPPNLTVMPACAPSALGGQGDSTLVPFPFAGALLAKAATTPDTLYCTEPQTIQPAELRKLVATVTSYNTFIQSQATANGWIYFNPNVALGALKADTSQVHPFPSFGAPCAANPFGKAFTCDAIHASASTHKLIANTLIDSINVHYSTSIPKIP